MLVDDNADAADRLATLLKAQGHHVTVHYDVKDAMQSAAAVVPEAFLIGIGLPDMDGFELAGCQKAASPYQALDIDCSYGIRTGQRPVAGTGSGLCTPSCQTSGYKHPLQDTGGACRTNKYGDS